MVNAQDWTNAQTAVIGSVLIEPDCAGRVMAELRPHDFHGSFRTLFEAIVGLKTDGEAIDPVTVLSRIGPAYRDEIKRILDETPTAANVEAYIGICKRQSRLTRLASLGTELAGAATLEEARDILQKAQDVAVEQAGSDALGMQKALVRFYERHQNGERRFVTVGLPALDERLMIDLGDVLVLGGYPSDGKTALALQWCWHISETLPVGFFSFETSDDKIVDRAFTQAVPELRFTDVKRNTMDDAQWKGMSKATGKILEHKLEIKRAAGMTPEDVLGVTLSRGYRVIVLDYIQLVTPSATRRGGTRAEEVAEISKAFALMARRHNLLVIELSQLSRPPKTKDKKTPAPTLSSLRESGQLEQDADVVALLYRLEESEGSDRELFIAKNKEGRRGVLKLAFSGEKQRFYREPTFPESLAHETEKKKKEKQKGNAPEEVKE